MLVVEAIRDGHTWGTAIIAETGASMTGVYSSLRRLRETGWVAFEVENAQLAAEQRRPRRTLYRLTNRAFDALGWPE